MSRKDSKGMFAAVLGKLDEDTKDEPQIPRSSSPHLMKVAAGVRQMQERSELAERLLKEGAAVIEIDPDDILPSSISDRFDSAYDDEAIAEIAQSILERGQIVPGLVRPVSGKSDQYQIVYGRRRLAAAKRLGIKFKAAIRELSDEEAVIFQGEENTAREDLSFIEKCLFAHAQEQAGFKRDTICASLSTGKSHISEMIRIGSTIDHAVLHAIGKAPGIGRGRWDDFSKRWQVEGNREALFNAMNSAQFSSLPSDDRFINLLNLLADLQKPKPEAAIEKKKLFPHRQWRAIDRTVSFSMRKTDKKAVISMEAIDGPKFAEFIADQLEELYAEFRNQTAKTE
ncbi:ParB family chromosome partitioning protein [Paenochrobactrum gallinarii]|uniref:ParB family chromosome partitioning protein n=1 Tax=Paenochrobactrum gallinarii TaxID=643673 RepID=A0A841MAQ7_9HYPH|nr:plasmid partitioning protein RepB [Paenochrobactrum gallinarii]MBB6262604.1 ParB family chromosome partitioning protein [Paenochrobactrum gallinarii]